jgi:AraC-like DNA-binding protein
MCEFSGEHGNYFRYLTFNEKDIAWQLCVSTVGRVTAAPGEPYPYKMAEHPSRYTYDWSTGRILDEYQFVYIVEGSGLFHSFEGDVFLSPGSLLQLVPGERHWYKPDNDTGWTEYWIGFTGKLADSWLASGFINRKETVFNYGVSKSLIALFTQAIKYAQNKPPHTQQLMSSLVPQMLAIMLSKRKQPLSEADFGSILAKALVIFEEHMFTRFDVESLTKALNISYYSLRDSFKEHTGMSPYQYLLHMKIQKAKELLVKGEMTVKEISYKLAFDNPYYFSRLFKKKTGVSPSKWNGARISYDLDYWDDEKEW